MLSKQEILRIIDEEIEVFVLEEGWKDKITKGLAAAALAGGMGLGGAAQASPGELTSVETPITQVAQSQTAVDIAAALKSQGVEGYSADDLNNLGKLLDKALKLSGSGTTNAGLEEWAVSFIVDAQQDGASKDMIIKAVEGVLKKAIAKRTPAKTTTSNVEMRNNPVIVQQSVLGMWSAAARSSTGESECGRAC